MTDIQDQTDNRATDAGGSLNTKDMRRILASSFLGSVIEYYDFLLYTAAASIVFSKVFFTDLPPGFGLFLSFTTLAVGYLARPLGGIIFGHFGDLVGRKKMLVISMVIMGISTVGIGLLPATAQIGLAAPIGLGILRIIQGVALGGEWGGAALMALEHAPASKRGFAASFANAGGPAGAILGTLVLSLFAAVSGDQFLEWGWRVPFLLSAVLILVGLVVRLKVSETPSFQRLEMEGEQRKVPLVDVFRYSKKAVLLGTGTAVAFLMCGAVTTVWGVASAVEAGVDTNVVLNLKATSAFISVFVVFASARLSDRIGRRRMLTIGMVLGVVLAYPVVLMLTSGTAVGFAAGMFLGNGLVQGILTGPIAAFISEQFPARNRYTGGSVAYQSASVIGAGFGPAAITGVILIDGGAVWPVAVLWIAVFLISFACLRAAPEGTQRMID
ncbi:MFS transporter [Brevibacterium sp. 'Marine']|uniref:MFS transporter n=1 Tax=Brevibacterium sp. 'Marine' TaxID=2725563 RepID=UPI00145F7AAC|nr:MFS transporter [Brevibacterium sp. 'Marine']